LLVFFFEVFFAELPEELELELGVAAATDCCGKPSAKDAKANKNTARAAIAIDRTLEFTHPHRLWV
jgi:hypothetical protein